MKLGKLTLIPFACFVGAVTTQSAFAQYRSDYSEKDIPQIRSGEAGKATSDRDSVVSPNPETNAPFDQGYQSQSGSMAMSDATITTKVKSALLADRGLPSSQINVQTNNGVVQLSGFVNSQAEMDRAAQIASGVTNVKSVENNLQTR